MNVAENKSEPSQPKTFEAVFSSVLIAPILFFLFAKLLGHNLGFLFSIISTLLFLLCLQGGSVSKSSFKALFPRAEIEQFLVFLSLFALCFWFCYSWADFIAIGERLRDYALLASVKDSPLTAKEPWMTGANLNYYLYWYRFAAFWSNIFNLEVWHSYHLLAAFSFSFFLATIFRLTRKYFRLSFITSLITSALIGFGSNADGVINAFSADQNWWGPSRVIKGAINEFPAWSFLLGDLHPHYLNLCLAPFILCLVLAVAELALSWHSRSVIILALFSVSAPLFYNSNAWEVPMAGIYFSCIIALVLVANFRTILKSVPSVFNNLFKDLSKPCLSAIFAAIFLSLISLIMSAANIEPADYPWRWVKDPVPTSTFAEIARHWGIPLFLICATIFAGFANYSGRSKILVGIFALSIAFQSTACSFIILAVCLTDLAFYSLAGSRQTDLKLKISVLFSLGIGSLILLGLGELVYLDDPYGGENERMNTIFKIYSATWAPLHFFACVFAYDRIKNLKLKYATALLMLACLPAFFIATSKTRKNHEPGLQGLASLNQEFPGARQAVTFLRSLPRTTVLEAQGNPYSYTSFLSTLGGHDSYLGWANHVGLLTGKHEEVARREKITADIYNGTDCEQKKQIALAEGIKLIAIGYLERQKYEPGGLDSFGCMAVKYDANQHIFLIP